MDVHSIFLLVQSTIYYYFKLSLPISVGEEVAKMAAAPLVWQKSATFEKFSLENTRKFGQLL